jgi:hypothetical protein
MFSVSEVEGCTELAEASSVSFPRGAWERERFLTLAQVRSRQSVTLRSMFAEERAEFTQTFFGGVTSIVAVNSMT